MVYRPTRIGHLVSIGGGHYYAPAESRAGANFPQLNNARSAEQDLRSAKFFLSTIHNYDESLTLLKRVDRYLVELGAIKEDGDLVYQKKDTHLGRFIENFYSTVESYLTATNTRVDQGQIRVERLEKLVAANL